ncbi:hypothetical protein ABPG72_003814 [Tetrahymena utriculariae]
MENKDIFGCLKMVQNSLNYSIVENLQKLQDNKVEQNFESQLCFIETFKEQIINDIYSITDLIICKLQNPKNINCQKQLKNRKQDQSNQEQMQDEQDHTLSKQQDQPQKQVVLISDEEREKGGYEKKKNQKRKNEILKREQIQNIIYQQFLNSYDPIKRNKSQIIYYLSEQTGWSVSTIQNIIRKFELKKVNPIIYKNKSKILEFMQNSQFQGSLGKKKSKQNSNEYCYIDQLDQKGDQTSKLLDSGYSFNLEKKIKKTIKQEYVENSKFFKAQE